MIASNAGNFLAPTFDEEPAGTQIIEVIAHEFKVFWMYSNICTCLRFRGMPPVDCADTDTDETWESV
jgi:hypothetical protein